MEEVVGTFARKLALTETEVEVVLPEEAVNVGPQRWFIVCELLTPKPFRVESLINTMKGLWIPKSDPPDRGRIVATQLGDGRMLFAFKREADLKWAIKGCPWSFDKALLAVAVTDGREDPSRVSLNTQYFWIRIRGLPPVYLEEKLLDNTGRLLGQAIGDFVRAVKGCGVTCLGEYLRIRVGVSVEAPLKRWVSFKPVGWLERKSFDLEYERLPHFCFYCGLLTHTGGRCPRRESGGFLFQPMMLC
ncbi:uncharacterized protein LOC133716839 [Rosa rugosa]|uniref:uncharacterized protein LOC133716839 n=1 Tax=Rosa rugosa TaxID=74645 RepID=UPI002B4083B5|nr:uncharacterized protein LOC133716839 [Rosa rugosa]